MRTVTAGTITQALIDAQEASGKVPYIKIYINSTDYSSRLLYLEHHEEAYRDRAVIGLSNRDNALDDIDLDGKEFEIGYGYDSSGQGGSATDKVDTATLWVKSHLIISVMGERIYQIYAEGMWMALRKQKVISGVTGPQGEMYHNIFDASHTVYGLIELIIEGAMSWTLEDSPPDDDIMEEFWPVFEVNQMPFENAAALLYRLIWMTKEYLRPKASKTFQCVYPQTTDAVDETYYSDQAPRFLEHNEGTILLEPNGVVVLCNQDPDNEKWNTDNYPLIAGTASDATQIAKNALGEIVGIFLAGNIRNQDDANRRAAAILTRLKAEILSARTILPFHDCRVELYDRVQVRDLRGV